MYNRRVKKTYLYIVLALMATFGGFSSVSAQTTPKPAEKAPVITSTEEQVPTTKTEADFRTMLAKMTSFQMRIQAATTRLTEKGIDIKASQTAIDKTTLALAETKVAIDAYAKVADDAKPGIASKEAKLVETSFEALRQALIQSLLSLKGALTDTVGA